MRTVTLAALDLIEAWSETDERRGARFNFPIFSSTGACASAVVYFEVDPAKHLGMHTDSAEEVVMVVAGTAEVIVGAERGSLETGELALVPAKVHDVSCAGDQPVRVVGWFASPTVVSVFDEPFGADRQARARHAAARGDPGRAVALRAVSSTPSPALAPSAVAG